jgi:hypothetical protein
MNSLSLVVSIIVAIIALVGVGYQLVDMVRQSSISRERISSAETRLKETPDKIKPAWDLARVTLESYLNRNLTQISLIFFLCVLAMLVGFAIIVWGVSLAFATPESFNVAVLATVAGLITEFVAVTFLFIYRSTVQQASNYTKMLERINSVGMAMQILDTIPENGSADDLKNKTKATLVELLVKETHVASAIQSPLP